MKTLQKEKLSERAVEYINKYAIKLLNISSQIDENMFDKIFELADEDEMSLLDGNGYEKQDLTSELKNRFILAMDFITDCSQIIPDLDDLNQRLNLK